MIFRISIAVVRENYHRQIVNGGSHVGVIGRKMTGSEPAAIMDMDPGVWRRELGLSDDELPVAIVSEGSWWREQRTRWRLGCLDDTRELPFPDIFFGRWRGRPLLYCCAYGAPRAVEIAHLGGCLGSALAIQIGTCGALQPGLATGDIVLPETAACREGIAQIYGAGDRAPSDPELTAGAKDQLEKRGDATHVGAHLTWPSIFAQSSEMIRSWRKEGFLSVDMETATTFAVARHLGMAAVSMLVVWDQLLNSRSFLDPLPKAARLKLEKGNASVFDVALDLIASL